jgi:hypothetical protein
MSPEIIRKFVASAFFQRAIVERSDGKGKSFDDELRDVESSIDDLKQLITNLRLHKENADEAARSDEMFAKRAA